MSAVEINGLDINEGTNYRVRSISHDDSPPMRMSTLEIARRDGEELVSSSFAPKRIEIEGTIKASTRNNLVDKIDDLKKYCLKDDLVDLDIPYGSSTRRYEVQVSNVFIGDETFNLTFAPFTIVCEAIEEPYGRATSWSEALSVDALTNEYETFSPTFSGSAYPVPKMRFEINTAGNLQGIHVWNKNTDTRLETFTGYQDNDILVVDTDEKDVFRNAEPFSFEGIFPEFEVGTNNIEVNFQTADSMAISQETGNTHFYVFRYHWMAQAIKPASALTVPKVEIFAKHITYRKTKTPDDITLRIETDNAGEPSGTLVDADAEVTISQSDITAGLKYWYVFEFDSDISLSSGTNYWIVIKEDWTAVTRTWYAIGRSSTDEYTGSDYTQDTKHSNDWGSTWIDTYNGRDIDGDIAFRVWDRQGASANWNVDMNIDYKKRYY